MNKLIEKMFEKVSTRKYLRNVNKKEIEIYIRNDKVNKDNNNKSDKKAIHKEELL